MIAHWCCLESVAQETPRPSCTWVLHGLGIKLINPFWGFYYLNQRLLTHTDNLRGQRSNHSFKNALNNNYYMEAKCSGMEALITLPQAKHPSQWDNLMTPFLYSFSLAKKNPNTIVQVGISLGHKVKSFHLDHKVGQRVIPISWTSLRSPLREVP